MAFQKATKKAARARVAFIGPSGAGKTFTSLRVARGLVGPQGRIALADSERGSASKYAGLFDFDVQDLETFSPRDYIRVIQEAEAAGYDALIIDSLSHAWMGKGGALEMVDAASKASKSRNSFDAWRSVTPEHNAMVDAIVRARMHIIVTMRVKTDYVVEEVNGKKTPRKVGLAPVQRDGLEYEFDVVADLDGAEAVITKTRCSALAKAVIPEPGEALGQQLRDWLTDGVPEPVRSAVVAFGPYKGKTCSELSDDQLSETIDLANEKLAEQPDAKWAKAMRENLGALEAEVEFRSRVPATSSAAQTIAAA